MRAKAKAQGSGSFLDLLRCRNLYFSSKRDAGLVMKYCSAIQKKILKWVLKVKKRT